MSPKRVFETEAERQSAYRQRRQDKQQRLLEAIVIAANSKVNLRKRLEAIRDIWLIARQPPESAHEAIATVVGHANVLLTSFAADPSISIPPDWQNEFKALLATTTGWLLQYKSAHGREDLLFQAMESTYDEVFGNQPLNLFTGDIHPDLKK